MSVIQDKIVNRIRQFGIGPSLVQIVQAGVRYIYVSNRNIVFVIRDFLSSTFEDSAIVPMTKERIERALVEGVLNERPVRLLTAFLEEGSRGLCAEIDGHLAGYAWIQFGGRYVFGRNGKLEIPPKYAIVKNLWVSPEFRGQKNWTETQCSAAGSCSCRHTPVVFIIPENRYVIRNWERHGFQRVLEINEGRWFKGAWKMNVKHLTESPEAESLVSALERGNKG
jgi:ribosomal protein S18 acetylase RimI-like enzyme